MPGPARLESQDPRFAAGLFEGAGASYDLLSEVLSFGQYRRWQSALVAAAQRSGIGPASRVLDVATGTGKIAAALVGRTDCRVVGLDLTRGMLLSAAAKRRTDPALRDRHDGLIQGTAERLPFPDAAFDGLTFSYLYRYVPDPEATTRELLRVVKPGGFIGFVEFAVPDDPAVRALWRLHTRLNLPAVGAAAGPAWGRIGRFLGPNIERFCDAWTDERLAAMLRSAGAATVRWRRMSLGGGLVMWADKKGPEA